MNAKWFGVALLAAVAAGCGEGRAILDVDVYSFLKGANQEAVPYLGGVSATIPPQQINSIGIGGSSIVDTIRVTGTVDFENTAGTGNVTFEVFFDSVAATLYSGAPALSVHGAVTPGVTTTSPFTVPNLADAVRPLFLASTVYVGLRASASAGVQGTARL